MKSSIPSTSPWSTFSPKKGVAAWLGADNEGVVELVREKSMPTLGVLSHRDQGKDPPRTIRIDFDGTARLTLQSQVCSTRRRSTEWNSTAESPTWRAPRRQPKTLFRCKAGPKESGADLQGPAERLPSLSLRPIHWRLPCLPGLADRSGLAGTFHVDAALVEPERWVPVGHQPHINQ
jgi:hypothetical protein